jgi:hypothetical protein
MPWVAAGTGVPFGRTMALKNIAQKLLNTDLIFVYDKL